MLLGSAIQLKMSILLETCRQQKHSLLKTPTSSECTKCRDSVHSTKFEQNQGLVIRNHVFGIFDQVGNKETCYALPQKARKLAFQIEEEQELCYIRVADLHL